MKRGDVNRFERVVVAGDDGDVHAKDDEEGGVKAESKARCAKGVTMLRV
jgi:hypothetical protein